jgi:hypothetical protein
MLKSGLRWTMVTSALGSTRFALLAAFGPAAEPPRITIRFEAMLFTFPRCGLPDPAVGLVGICS